MTDAAAAPATPAKRLVNLRELADVVGISTNTLRDLVRDNAGTFPVESFGANGVPYEFDLDAAVAWYKDFQRRQSEASAARQAELRQYRLEMFGDQAADDDAELSPDDRRKLAEAQLAEDRIRRQRAELVERAAVETSLDLAVAEIRKDLLQVPTDFAKQVGLDREMRLGLETLIENALRRCSARLSQPTFYADGSNRAA